MTSDLFLPPALSPAGLPTALPALSPLESRALPQVQQSRTVEFSEAHAYRSLVNAPSAEDRSRLGLRAVVLGGAAPAGNAAGIALVADGIQTSLALNRVLGLGLNGPVTDAVLDEIAALYGPAASPYALELGPLALTAELLAKLRARRLRRMGAQTAVFLHDLKAVPVVDCSLRIEQVGAQHAEQLADICCTTFNMPAHMAVLLKNAHRDSRWRQWMAFDGDTPAGAALSFVDGPVGWSGWAATLPPFRGRRFHAGYLAAALREAAASGCQWFTAETAMGTPEQPDPAYRNLLKLGFELLYGRTTFMATPATVKAAGKATPA
jgi:GNAT superfamily N-acetyltransferase